jgi:tetratricopeptide (TPR) repeat protein
LPSGGQLELTEKLLGEVEQGSLADHPTLAGMRHKARGLMTLGTQPSLAAVHFQQFLASCEAVSDFRGTFEARCNVAAALGSLGRLEEAERHFRELLAVAERMNLQLAEPILHENLGILRADQGALEDGRVLIETALAAALRQGDPRIEARCHHDLAVIDGRAGRFESAEGHARAAVTNAVMSIRPLALAGLAGALLGQRRLDEALEQAREANRLLDAQGYVEDNEALVRLSLVECLLASGDLLEAREAGVRAYRRLIERAAAIEPEWRTSFLTALPDHRRTVEVAEVLGLASN